MIAAVGQLFDDLGDHAVAAVAAVIGGDVKISRNGLHFIFQDDQVLGLGPDDDVHVHAVLMQPLDLGIDGSGAHAASDEQHLFIAQVFRVFGDEGRGLAQGAGDIGEEIAGLQLGHPFGGCPHGLEDDGDGAFSAVVVTDGQRDPFPPFVHPHDQKLPGFAVLGDTRGFHIH